MFKIFISIAILLLVLFSNLAFANEQKTTDVENLNAKILELQQQIIEMQKKHEAEINALKTKVEQLAVASGAEKDEVKQTYEQRITAMENRLEEKEKQESLIAHKASPVGSYSGQLNPDISVVANILTNFNDDKADDNRNKVRVKEAELALQGYLYPGIRGDVIAAIEQEYEGDTSTTETDLEEAYVSFLDLPCSMQAEVGRKFIGFGKLNPIHPHHWPFADTPLVLQNFFGEHNWFDDGASVSALVPNPWDLYFKASFGVFNGRNLEHAHEHEEEEEHTGETEPIDWNGRVYVTRLSANKLLNDNSDVDLGYSLAWDEPRDTELHGVDLTYSYRWPYTYRKLKWQNEFLFANVDSTSTQSSGFYSLLKLTLDKNWELGGRYDWSQTLENDQSHEWAITPFLTYYFTESFYTRAQYRYRELIEEHEPENVFFLQLVWGLGPHSHRLED